MTRRNPTAPTALTNEQLIDLTDVLYEVLVGVFGAETHEATAEAEELRDATVSWLRRQEIVR